MQENHSQLEALLQILSDAINTEFGDNVKVCRDCLYERFAVNNFSFEIIPLDDGYSAIIEFLERFCLFELHMKLEENLIGETFVKADDDTRVSFLVSRHKESKGNGLISVFLS